MHVRIHFHFQRGESERERQGSEETKIGNNVRITSSNNQPRKWCQQWAIGKHTNRIYELHTTFHIWQLHTKLQTFLVTHYTSVRPSCMLLNYVSHRCCHRKHSRSLFVCWLLRSNLPLLVPPSTALSSSHNVPNSTVTKWKKKETWPNNENRTLLLVAKMLRILEFCRCTCVYCVNLKRAQIRWATAHTQKTPPDPWQKSLETHNTQGLRFTGKWIQSQLQGHHRSSTSLQRLYII